MEFEKQRDFVLYCTEGYYKVTLCKQIKIMWCTPCAHCDMVPFRELCAIRTWHQYCWWLRYMLLFAQLQTHRVTVNRTWALFHGFKCGNTWKSSHPLFGWLVRCSAHGWPLARLRYHYYSSVNYQQELTFLCNFSHALQNPIAVIESKKFMYWRCTYQHPFSTL